MSRQRSVSLSRADGFPSRSIVSSLVRSELSTFLLNLAKWLAIAVPACYCNAMLEFLQSKLSTAYRTRLTEHVLASYLEDGPDGKNGQIFYKMGNLDDRIKNADQCVCWFGVAIPGG